MVSSQEQTPRRASADTARMGRLFLLDLSDNRVVSLNPISAFGCDLTSAIERTPESLSRAAEESIKSVTR